MAINILTILLCFITLIWSASHLLKGALGLGDYYQLSPLFTGFTLVALGTSAPEIIIAINASLAGLNDIAIGNAIGTNIANIGLVLGCAAIIKPLRMQPALLRREYPILFLVMLFTYSLMIDGYIGVIDSCLFLIACLGFISYVVYRTKHAFLMTKITQKIQHQSLTKVSFKHHLICFFIGIVLLPLSAYVLVQHASLLAEQLGVSNLVIALTIVAIGSCLPELTTSLVAIKKGADDIAIGNILGTNILNLLAVLVVPGALHPALISHAILWRDLPFMIFATLVLLWFNYHNRNQRIERWHGCLLLTIYACYILSIFISSHK